MNQIKMVKFFTQIFPALPLLYSPCRLQVSFYNQGMLSNKPRFYAKSPGAKGPSKEEQIERIKMPGFVHPETKNEEGYFTQKAKQQLEELKKRLEKPKIDNSEKHE